MVSARVAGNRCPENLLGGPSVALHFQQEIDRRNCGSGETARGGLGEQRKFGGRARKESAAPENALRDRYRNKKNRLEHDLRPGL